MLPGDDMPRRLALTLLFAFLPMALSAQTMTSFTDSGETDILPYMPFHAERVTHMERNLADGSVQSREVHETIDRDSKGRLLIESKIVTSGGVPPAQANIFHLLIDPVAHVSTNWNTASTTAMTRPVSLTAHVRVTASPLTREEPLTVPEGKLPYPVTTEDLGKRTIAGLTAIGTRTTTTVPADHFSTAKPVLVSHEIWMSPDLQITLLEIDKSPFTGTTTSEIVSLSRAEPSASLFHVPDGLTVKAFSFPNGGVNLGTPQPATPTPLRQP
jgi:hypothetical protein